MPARHQRADLALAWRSSAGLGSSPVVLAARREPAGAPRRRSGRSVACRFREQSAAPRRAASPRPPRAGRRSAPRGAGGARPRSAPGPRQRAEGAARRSPARSASAAPSSRAASPASAWRRPPPPALRSTRRCHAGRPARVGSPGSPGSRPPLAPGDLGPRHPAQQVEGRAGRTRVAASGVRASRSPRAAAAARCWSPCSCAARPRNSRAGPSVHRSEPAARAPGSPRTATRTSPSSPRASASTPEIVERPRDVDRIVRRAGERSAPRASRVSARS